MYLKRMSTCDSYMALMVILFVLRVVVSVWLCQQTARADQAAETDMHSEYARQREHLERSVASLRKKLAKDTEIHRTDTIRVMQVGHV